MSCNAPSVFLSSLFNIWTQSRTFSEILSFNLIRVAAPPSHPPGSVCICSFDLLQQALRSCDHKWVEQPVGSLPQGVNVADIPSADQQPGQGNNIHHVTADETSEAAHRSPTHLVHPPTPDLQNVPDRQVSRSGVGLAL